MFGVDEKAGGEASYHRMHCPACNRRKYEETHNIQCQEYRRCLYQILRKVKRVRDIEGFKTVYITPNKTLHERISRRKLFNELKKKRLGDPSGRYFIRKGEIVKADITEPQSSETSADDVIFYQIKIS